MSQLVKRTERADARTARKTTSSISHPPVGEQVLEVLALVLQELPASDAGPDSEAHHKREKRAPE
jgi:hypothetical protein